MYSMEQAEADFSLELSAGNIKQAMKEIGAASGDLWKVPPDELQVIDGFNVRLKTDKWHARVRQYANSMKSSGYMLHKPMAGWVAMEGGKKVIYITDGHTRLAAVKLANSELPKDKQIKVVSVVTHDQKNTTMQELNLQLIKGNRESELLPYEAAIVCNRLRAAGLDIAAIAKETDYSTEWVGGLLQIFDSPRELRQMVVDNVITATLAIEVIKEHGKDALAVLKNALVEKTGISPDSNASNQFDTAAGIDDGASTLSGAGTDTDADAEGDVVPKGDAKVRLTKKDLVPAEVRKFNNAVKKKAPVMYSTLSQVRKDPAFNKLKPEVREQMLSLLDDLSKHEVPDGESNVNPNQTDMFGGEGESASQGAGAEAAQGQAAA